MSINEVEVKNLNHLFDSELIHEDDDEDEDEEEVNYEVVDTFPNYKEDKSFGGNKRLMEVYVADATDVIDGYDIGIKYINKYKGLSTFKFLNDVAVNWVKRLFENNLLKMGPNVIDYNNKTYKMKMMKCKNNSKRKLITDKKMLPDISSYVSDRDKFELELWETFVASRKIDNKCYQDFKDVKDEIYLPHVYPEYYERIFGRNEGVIQRLLSIIKTKKFLIDESYVRQFIPYQILISKGELTILNRDYTIIDEVELDPALCVKSVYLYKDGSQPYNIPKIKLYMDKLNKLKVDVSSITTNEHTRRILNVFKEIVSNN
jgi:hypothetical protein